MDTSVRPGDDFFAYANGTWLKNTEMPADKSRYGAFDKLRDESQEAVKAIIEESLESYSGSCACPYNRDQAGRKCGKRSAYSKPGGAEPICFESDVTDDIIARYLQTH